MKKILVITFLVSLLNITHTLMAAEGVKIYTFGNTKITVLQDMPMVISHERITNVDRKFLKELLPDNSCNSSLNTYIVEIDNETYLIDSGLGAARGGMLINKLESVGYKPSDIKNIILTHLHYDHFGGLVNDDGNKVYPNATVYIAKQEHDFWSDKSNIDNVPTTGKAIFDTVAKLNTVYADSIKTFGLNKEVIGGILSIATVGHTPGHTSFEIPVGTKERVIIMGDIIHCLAVQIVDPNVALVYDYDTPSAIKTRTKLFDRVAKYQILIMGSHIPFPGVGYIEKTYKPGLKYKFIEKK